ncbi:MAG: fused MFS/spermidine synthase [Methylomonas sp.]|nr:fused MFS/spermidine synthase [Methylomonas sp.]
MAKQSKSKTLPASKLATLNRSLLLFTVTLCGGAVMILELLGTRIIAPFYGASLYIWSSLIAVTMIALALGYYMGGFLADRYPKLRLAHIVLLAALATSSIPLLSGWVLNATSPLGMRGGAFVSAFLLFTLPLTALAMVGPFVIKLATETLDDVGSTVGSVYAISTLGSVAATLLLGFLLLPVFGTRGIIFSLGIVLVLLGIVLILSDKRAFTSAAAVTPVMALAVLSTLLSANGYARPQTADTGFTVLHEAESIYGWVRVVDNRAEGIRLLLSDASVLSATRLTNGQTLLGYQLIIGSLPVLRPAASDALVIGLGGGHIARELKAKGLITDTIEIDPVVADASLQYFDFKPTGQFIVGDARYEVKHLDKRYDFIVHDCFTGGSEPTHLLTVEMLQDLRRLLKDDGMLALNYVGFTRGEGTAAVASVYKTLKQVLPHVRVFVTEKTEMTDFIFLASNQAVALDQGSHDPRAQWLIDHEYALSEDGGIVITDDYNPMESLQVRKSETYRELFIKRVASELLLL